MIYLSIVKSQVQADMQKLVKQVYCTKLNCLPGKNKTQKFDFLHNINKTWNYQHMSVKVQIYKYHLNIIVQLPNTDFNFTGSGTVFYILFENYTIEAFTTFHQSFHSACKTLTYVSTDIYF